MPTNEQRRQAAKRKLERQVARREERARKRQIWTFTGIGAVVLLVAVALTVWLAMRHQDAAAEHATAEGVPPEKSIQESISYPAPATGGGLPAFATPSESVAHCQYIRAGKAAKKVDLPRTDPIPRDDPKRVSVSIKTNQGNIGLQLDNEKSPCTTNSFASLAQKGYFDNTPCHRLSTKGLGMLQCGDPSGTGSGGPGYQFPNEYPTDQYKPKDPELKEPVLYPRGTIAMANSGPDTNGSQFFLMFKDSQLPPAYTVFGIIDETGLATLDKIAAAGDDGSLDPSPGGGKPNSPVTIEDIQLD